MDGEEQVFDFWYAVNNTEILMMPERHLETFGTTTLNYHMVSELMDSVGQIRVREGRLQASRPKIITPEAYSSTVMEGFGDEAEQYVDWLREHEQDVRILQYGYTLKQESFSEHTVTDDVKTVAERVQDQVKDSGDPFSAVMIGVDNPWDVCLVKLFWEVIQSSAGPNIQEMERRQLFGSTAGIPNHVRHEIDQAFLAATRNPALISGLGKLLQHYGVFERYQDRFFSLVKLGEK